MTRALVLFAHGARDPRWAEPFEAVATQVRAVLPAVPVALAFLELMAPSLEEAAQRLAEGGATTIDVVPLFLGTGGHLRGDLPRLVDAVRAAHPGLAVRLHAVIGEQVSVIEAMARAAVSAAGFGE